MIEAVKQLASTILHKHYCENDVEFVIRTFAPDITWIGAGDGQHLDSYDEIVDFFRKCKGAIPPCRIWGEEYHVTLLTQNLYLCDGEAWIATDEKENMLVKVRQRVSFLFRWTGGKLECVHIHCSNPYQEMAEGELFPDKVGKTTYEYVQEKIQDVKNVEIVLNAISGGLKISRDDATYSYAYVSDELCAMFGYTKEEFFKATDGSAVGAVFPPDLPRALHDCSEAFEKGPDYATKYRVRCKDGSLKWIIDSGKKQTDENGNTIINSIYLDVTSFEDANQKIAEQRDFLDSVYSSIMCGILRYRIEDGSFAFITLNKEALRMLGYKSEEECYYEGADAFYQKLHPDDRQTVLDKIASLRHPGEHFSHEYRIVPSEGKVIWVYGVTELIQDAEGKSIIQRTMIDVTDRKMLEMALEEERQRFRIAIESSPAIIFEYDIEKDICTTYGSLEPLKDGTSHEGTIRNFLNENMQKQVEKPYWESIKDFLRGNAGTELICRMASYFGGDHVLWAKITLTILYSDDHRPVKTIGKVRNIQSEKEKEFALEEAKSRDGLTGLYTNEAGTRIVREYMKRKDPDEPCSMMLLDLDDFSRINEMEGMVFADVILQEVADIIRNEAGDHAVCIRLGGDEFMIFLKGIHKPETIALGSRIAQLISNLFVKEVISVRVSASIGMCNTIVPEAQDYAGLYRCAESTLNHVKLHQKGRAACYVDTSKEIGTDLTALYRDEHPINAIDTHSGRKEEDLVYALDLLGKSKNLDDAITLLLSRIGRSYQLDRISIIEVNADYFSYRYTYQWAKNPADQQLGIDFYLGKEEFDKIKTMYDGDGLSEVGYGEGADKSSNLHAAIWNRGVYAGALNFRKNEWNYPWTEEQRNFLKELVKIVSSYIMKARADAVSQAKTDFLSKMSHEIRTPMNAIMGMTAIAKNVLDDKEAAKDCLNKIESANRYLLNLINDVLDMSRIESGKVELNYDDVDMVRFLKSLETLLKPQADEKGIRFAIENHYVKSHPLLADSLRLNQVMVNLIGNAVKFTPDGGCITVRVIPKSESADTVTLQFEVEDSGIGIAKEDVGRIFNAFEQASSRISSQYGGTGLGLTISSHLIQLMGGALHVESELGRGSVFSFALCLELCKGNKENPQKEEVKPASKQYDLSGRRVLIVEDHELNREIAQTILEINGFVTETACDGQEAVNLFVKNKAGYYDAILMDIRMPVMNGLEATRRMRTMGKADSRTIPIIAMTANAFDEDTKKSMESGMNGHLSKPLEMDHFLDMLKKCMQNGSQNKDEINDSR